jgi:hypothetical protein
MLTLRCLQRFPHLPIAEQLAQLYKREGNSQRLLLRPESKAGIMNSLWDSPGWKENVHDTGFSRERRNIALALSTDGVNPFKKMQYSMWPILLLVAPCACLRASLLMNICFAFCRT